MARIKGPPKVAHPDPDPLLGPESWRGKLSSRDKRPFMAKQIGKDNDKFSPDNRIRSKLSIATEGEESVATTETPTAEHISEAELGSTHKAPPTQTYLHCPQCDSKFCEKGI